MILIGGEKFCDTGPLRWVFDASPLCTTDFNAITTTLIIIIYIIHYTDKMINVTARTY